MEFNHQTEDIKKGEEITLRYTFYACMTGTCIMGKMREDRAPIKWNKKFVYPNVPTIPD